MKLVAQTKQDVDLMWLQPPIANRLDEDFVYFYGGEATLSADGDRSSCHAMMANGSGKPRRGYPAWRHGGGVEEAGSEKASSDGGVESEQERTDKVAS